MANIVSKNVEKGTTNLIVVAIATALSVSVVKGAKALGVDVDNAQITMALVAVISGLLSAAQNWIKHREKAAPTIKIIDKKE